MENKELKVIDCVAEVAENNEAMKVISKSTGKKAGIILATVTVVTAVVLGAKKGINAFKARRAEKKAKVEETSKDTETYDDSFEYEDK